METGRRRERVGRTVSRIQCSLDSLQLVYTRFSSFERRGSERNEVKPRTKVDQQQLTSIRSHYRLTSC